MSSNGTNALTTIMRMMKGLDIFDEVIVVMSVHTSTSLFIANIIVNMIARLFKIRYIYNMWRICRYSLSNFVNWGLAGRKWKCFIFYMYLGFIFHFVNSKKRPRPVRAINGEQH